MSWLTHSAPSSPLACAAYVMLAMSLAATVHLAWLRSSASTGFRAPIDGARTWRGRRLFGDNKQWRGLMALPPAAAFAFVAVEQALRAWWPQVHANLWPMSSSLYAVAGASCGLAFMAAELPNSFLKRQLGVAPGQPAGKRWQRLLCNVADRFDSVTGLVLMLWLLVPLPAAALWTLLLGGPALHAAFSVAQYAMGQNSRPL